MTRKKIHIIKIGGDIIDKPNLLNECLRSLLLLSDPWILVHGGGKAGSRMLKSLEIPVKYVEGRRITDEETLRVVTMVYAGEINKYIVAILQAKGCNAIGLSGCDGNLVQARKREAGDIDYGYAGDIIHVNTGLVELLWENGLTPVVNPITHDLKGQLLNTNADTIAATLGEALSSNCEVHIHYCFEFDGVLKDIDNPSSVIPVLNESQFESLAKERKISSGMIPKLYNAFNGLKKGVTAVTIGNHYHFVRSSTCTKIVL